MFAGKKTAAGAPPYEPIYVEDVFSTQVYTSTGANITVTNDIDLSTKGGLVWIKARTVAFENYLTDTARGAGRVLYSNLVNGQSGVGGGGASAFNTTGYVDGNQSTAGYPHVSWTFRKQPKFFHVVSWTGDGDTERSISHPLGSIPGVVIIKRTDTSGDWKYTDFTTNKVLRLNSTDEADTAGNVAGGFCGSRISTSFKLTAFGGSMSAVNAIGGTYVAYVFASNAGGFGPTGTDSVISCGSYTGSSSNVSVNLGWEPQWLLVKNITNTSGSSNWNLVDSTRGLFTATGPSPAILRPNISYEETATGTEFSITSTGFIATAGGGGGSNYNGDTFVYIAIRRGLMKVPTDATKVFKPVIFTGNNTTQTLSIGFPTDLYMTSQRNRDSNNYFARLVDRLRGRTKQIATNATFGEGDFGSVTNGVQGFDNMTNVVLGTSGGSDDKFNQSAYAFSSYSFRRAAGFFDIVGYTGNGSSQAVSHNLTVVPNIIIMKSRGTGDWGFYFNDGTNEAALLLNSSSQKYGSGIAFGLGASTFTVYGASDFPMNNNSNAVTYVAYLFASLAGISKVGQYTGTGTTLQINCGFAAGARFVLIKRTNSTGDWYIWDTARGIISGNDPYLLLNSTAAEVTGTDYIDPYSAGFEISSSAPAAINASGGTYIFLAIA